MTSLRFNEPQDLAGGADVPVEVRRPNLGLVARTTLSQEVVVSPGRYHISARLPSGTELFGSVDAFGDGVVVDLELDPGEPATSSRTKPSLAPKLERLEARDVEDMTLRLLCGNALTGELEEVRVATIRSILENAEPVTGVNRPMFVQLTGQHSEPLNVAVPVAEDQEADLDLARKDDGSLIVVPRLAHPQADLLCRYRAVGALHEAATAATSPVLDAQSLLYHKVQDPIAAAVGGYSLLRFAALERLHNWTENLYRWFPWLPDGAAIRGEHLARSGEHDAALECFCAVGNRGLPLFSDGVAFTVNRLRFYLDVGNATFDLNELDRAQLTLQRLAPFAAVIDFGDPIVRFGGDFAELAASGYGPPPAMPPKALDSTAVRGPSNRIAFEWALRPGTHDDEIDEFMRALEALDHTAELSLLPSSRGILPIDAGAIIVGVMAIPSLAGRVLDLVRATKRGIVIDARLSDHVRVIEQPALPGGTVVTIDRDGTSHTYEACKSGIDLSRIISALHSPHP